MSPEKKPRYQNVRDQITEQIDWFKGQREKDKNYAFWVYIAIATINAIITILLGLQGMSYGTALVLRDIALALSSGVTVLTAYEAFYGHKALWVRYTQTVTQLYGLLAKLDYRLSAVDGLTDKETDQFFDNLQSILADTNASWNKQRAEAPEKPS